MASVLQLTGETLTPQELLRLGGGGVTLELSPEAWRRVEQGRQVVDSILEQGQVAYGINTGFGLFSEVVIPPDKLRALQVNLIRSHAAGVGPPLSPERTRMLLALRANVLAKGHSGVGAETVRRFLAAFNKDCLSAVPCKGTVGASGDLAPLSHLALGLMGEGGMWDPALGRVVPDAGSVLRNHGLTPLELGAKEGLALINGTQLVTSLGAEAVVRAGNAALCADLACALTLEVLKGTSNAFHPAIHETRPHPGQQRTAAHLRAFLLPRSEIFRGHRYKGKVQDAYCLRCAPQVHGVVHDTVSFVEGILRTEMNSATDNPMIFTGDPALPDEAAEGDGAAGLGFLRRGGSVESLPEDAGGAGLAGPGAALELDSEKDKLVAEVKRLRAALREAQQPGKDDTQHKAERCTFYRGPGGFVISGGNFHGEYPAKALDYLAIGVQELANISERRIERLCNPMLSDMPAFLVREGGLNSGFMIAHCTAAACASENKVLTHPASVDTISTSAAKEDHVSMGGFAARKALEVVENVETVIAIEVLAACQALEFFRPARSTPALEAVHGLVRQHVKPWGTDRVMHVDIDAVVLLLRSGRLWEAAAPFLEAAAGAGAEPGPKQEPAAKRTKV